MASDVAEEIRNLRAAIRAQVVAGHSPDEAMKLRLRELMEQTKYADEIGDVDAEPTDVPDDTQQRAELIADVLASLYGDDAEALLGGGDDEPG